MHELGIVCAIVDSVDKVVKEQNLTKVDSIVLQVGEVCSAIPEYLEECYPAAVDGTPYEDTKLKIEIMPANAICQNCGCVFNIVEHDRVCPKCKTAEQYEVISGTELFIKEIIAC